MFVMAAVLAGLSGCAQHHQCASGACGQPETCPTKLFGGHCPGEHHGLAGMGAARGTPVAAPPFGAVTYPYYTTRGPRDFLAPAPRPIGP